MLRRIYRESSSSPTADRRLLRCIETNHEAVSFDDAAVQVDVDTAWRDGRFLRSHFPSVVNFDGDAFPDLVDWMYSCNSDEAYMEVCAGHDTQTNEDICYNVGANCTLSSYYYDNPDDGTGLLADDSRFDDGLDAVGLAQLDPDGGTWRTVDLNRDGATDLIVLGYVESPARYEVETWLGGADGFSGPSAADLVDSASGYQLLDVLPGAQFADVDGDGFVDLVYESGEEWVRNVGTSPYFDLDEAIPVESSMTDVSSLWFSEASAFTTCDPAYPLARPHLPPAPSSREDARRRFRCLSPRQASAGLAWCPSSNTLA